MQRVQFIMIAKSRSRFLHVLLCVVEQLQPSRMDEMQDFVVHGPPRIPCPLLQTVTRIKAAHYHSNYGDPQLPVEQECRHDDAIYVDLKLHQRFRPSISTSCCNTLFLALSLLNGILPFRLRTPSSHSRLFAGTDPRKLTECA